MRNSQLRIRSQDRQAEVTPAQRRLPRRCRAEIEAAGRDQLRFARECAYGTSFPDPSKRFRSAGWYFSNDQAFDLAVASQLDFEAGQNPRPEFLEAMVSNMNYEGGATR